MKAYAFIGILTFRMFFAMKSHFWKKKKGKWIEIDIHIQTKDVKQFEFVFCCFSLIFFICNSSF